MFRDREGGDCKGNSYNPAYQGLVTRVWGKHALANIQNSVVNFFFLRVKVPDIKLCSHSTTFRRRARPFTLRNYIQFCVADSVQWRRRGLCSRL